MHIHDVIDDVTRSQSTSNFAIDISPSIFELEGRPKAQNIGNANGYLSGIFNFWYNFRWKSLPQAQNGGNFKNFEILNTISIWPQICQDRSKLCPKNFLGDDVIDYVKWWPQSFPLYSCLGEVGCGSKLQGQCLVNKCKYHNGLYGLYKPTTISMNNTVRDCRSKVNTTGLLCDLQPKFGFTFSFQDRPMPHLVALSDGCSIGNVILAAEW